MAMQLTIHIHRDRFLDQFLTPCTSNMKIYTEDHACMQVIAIAVHALLVMYQFGACSQSACFSWRQQSCFCHLVLCWSSRLGVFHGSESKDISAQSLFHNANHVVDNIVQFFFFFSATSRSAISSWCGQVTCMCYLCKANMFCLVQRRAWQSKDWCVSYLCADWLIAICHSNLGDTLIWQSTNWQKW